MKRLVLLSLLAAFGWGQEFEVASMKPGTGLSLAPRREGERWTWRGAPLSELIQYAFDVGSAEIDGSAPRGLSPSFDVEAKLAADTPEGDARKMVQALLIERLDFKFRWDVREASVLVLSVGPKGHRMRAAQDAPGFKVDGKPVRVGTVGIVLGQYGRHFMGIGVPMARVVRLLGNHLQVPVIDRTGLTGTFDVDVLHTSEDERADPFLPPLRTAIQDTLGLRIESAKAPVRKLIVESIGTLREN